MTGKESISEAVSLKGLMWLSTLPLIEKVVMIKMCADVYLQMF
jgi:hypothetical protein